jgi:hypothetical protein
MAFPKSFFSDIPELVYEIIQYLHNDHITLSSCILVNRLWCRIAIPLLWEDPFSISTKNYNFIEIYLKYLDEKDKKKLQEYNIKIDSYNSNNTLLFNYPNFIKTLNTCKMIYSIEKWILNFKRSQNKNLLPPIFTTTLYNSIDCNMPEFDVNDLNLNFIRKPEFNLPSIKNLINSTSSTDQSFQAVQSIRSFRSVQSTHSVQSLQSYQSPQSLQSIQSPQSLQSIQSVQSLQPFQSLQSLQSFQSPQSLQSVQSVQSFQSPQSIQSLQSLHLTQSVQPSSTQAVQSIQFQDITSLFKNGKKGLIYKLLFKLFINYEANLHTFEIFLMRLKEYKYFNNVYDLILKNPKFIRSIKNLKLAFYNKGVTNLIKIDSFITFLSSNCDSISTLYLQFQFRNNNILIDQFSSRIINSQKNIKRIFFVYNTFSLNTSLSSLQNLYYSKNLKSITFFNVNFKNIIIIKEVFEQLNVLESIHILYCQFISSFINQIINITGPFKLRSLFLNRIIKLNIFNSLLQKSGNYLENFGLGNNISKDESKGQLLESIIKYCKNIQFFNLPEFLDQNFNYLTLDLIKSIEQNLNYLSIEFLNSNKLCSILLKELGQLLPFKLEFLKLSLIINLKDFKIFLSNSKNTFIKKLLIRNKSKLVGDFDILPLIEDHIIKMRKVKYLALKEDFIGGRDLHLLKDEVKKFKSYNIIVQNYNDLDTYNIYKHIKETY